MDVVIRKAKPQEAAALSELAIRSKGHWGYDSAFLEDCRDELRVDSGKLGSDNYECYVALDNDRLLGYFAIERLSESSFELDALFVDPPSIGRGVGRRLLAAAIERLEDLSASVLVIQGDPNADKFYEAAGARLVGTRESGSIPGRQLPLYELDIAGGAPS